MTSNTRARASMRSSSNSSSVRVRVPRISSAFLAESSIWARETAGSCCVIDALGLAQDPVPDVVVQAIEGVQVGPATEDRRQLVLHLEERIAGRLAGLEFHQNVHV